MSMQNRSALGQESQSCNAGRTPDLDERAAIARFGNTTEAAPSPVAAPSIDTADD